MGDKAAQKKAGDKADKIDRYLKVETMYSDKTEAHPKFQKDMPNVMERAAAEAIKRGKGVTSDEPTGNDAKGYVISGHLTKLTKETQGKQCIYSCVVKMVLAEWPSEKMLTQDLYGKARAAAQTGGSEKRMREDAEACVFDATKGATERAIDWIKQQP